MKIKDLASQINACSETIYNHYKVMRSLFYQLLKSLPDETFVPDDEYFNFTMLNDNGYAEEIDIYKIDRDGNMEVDSDIMGSTTLHFDDLSMSDAIYVIDELSAMIRKRYENS